MNRKSAALGRLYVALALVFLYLPILVIVAYSFNSSQAHHSAVFAGFTFDYYATALQTPQIVESLVTSIEVALVSVALSIVIAVPAAFVAARHGFPGKAAFESLALLPLLLPGVVLGVAFMSFYAFVGVPFGFRTLVLSHTTFCIPYVYILVSTRLVGFDVSLEEAARDLGANSWQTFRDVVLPVAYPAIVSAAGLGFAMSFDDVVISFFAAGATSNTLPLYIYSQTKLRFGPEINALCSMIILVAIGAVVVAALVRARGERCREEDRRRAISAALAEEGLEQEQGAEP